MQTKQIRLQFRGRLWQVGIIVAVVLLAGAPLQRVFADGGPAGFAFADNNSAFNTGSTIDLELLESGTDVQTVWANFSYPASLLQFQQAGFDNSLNTVAAGGVDCSVDPASGNGQVSLRCTANTPVNGTEIVADLQFTVIAPGTATLAMITGNNSATDITNSTGASIWDGALPHVTYALKGKTTSGGGGGSTVPSGGSGGSSTTPPAGGGTGGSSTPGGGNPASGDGTSTAPGSGGTLNFSISDALGRPLGGARVAADNGTIHYTDTDGKASFGIEAGQYTVDITAPGMVPQSLRTTVTTGSSKRFSLQLSPAAPGAALGLFSLLILGAYFGRSRLQRLRLRLPVLLPLPAGAGSASGIVVGDGGLTPGPAAPGNVASQPSGAPTPPPATAHAPMAAPVPLAQSGSPASPPYPYGYPAQPGPQPGTQPQYPYPTAQYPAQPPAASRPGGGYPTR